MLLSGGLSVQTQESLEDISYVHSSKRERSFWFIASDDNVWLPGSDTGVVRLEYQQTSVYLMVAQRENEKARHGGTGL